MTHLNQKARILKWFETHDTLTRFEAYHYLGIWESPARIHQLKKDDGYNFKTTLKTGISAMGDTYTYAIWRLIK